MAIQIKLDELIRVQKSANNALMDLEDHTEEDLKLVRDEFVRMAEEKREEEELERKNPSA